MANKVRVTRKRRGWTIRKLAEATGLTNGFLSEIENGKKAPGVYNALLISKALDRPVEELFPMEHKVV